MSESPTLLMSAEGLDGLIASRFVAHEALSRPYRATAEFLYSDATLDLNSLLGTHFTVGFATMNDGAIRYFDGLVRRARFVGFRRELAVYRVNLAPWLWFLTQSTDCRIFQNLSIPDIVQQVVDDAGFGDYSPALTGSYDPLTYCVQYAETHFNFISRLFEQIGIG